MDKIAVIGAGTMGAGIAQVAAEAGYTVWLHDIANEYLDKGMRTIQRFVSRNREKGKITQEQHDDILARIKCTTDFQEALTEAQMVIEAVLEKLDLKKDIFKRLDQRCDREVLLATNTSTLSITKIASVTNHPERVIGTHFFNPVPLMRLVEVVAGEKTSREMIQRAVEFCGSVRKEPITVKDVPGFIVNRFLCLLYNEGASQVQNQVASREDIDKGLKLGANHPMGILELMDVVGIDVIYYALQSLWEATGEERYRPCELFEKMVNDGHLGRKTGKGFYEY